DAFHPRQQLARLERLSDVVVRAGFEPHDSVHGFRSDRDHDDANARTLLSQPPRESESVFAWQSDIEQDECWHFALDQLAWRASPVSPAHLKFLSSQIAHKYSALRGLIFDDYDMGAAVHPV